MPKLLCVGQGEARRECSKMEQVGAIQVDNAVVAQVKVPSPPGHGEVGASSLRAVLQRAALCLPLLPPTALGHSGLPEEGSPPRWSPLGQALWGAADKDLLFLLSPWWSKRSSSAWCRDRSGRRSTLAHAAHPWCALIIAWGSVESCQDHFISLL